MPKALTKQHGALKSVAPALKAIAALRREISTASSLDQLNDISNAAAGLQRRFKPVKEVADEAGLVWTEAEIRLWRELKALEDEVGKAKGTAGRLTGPGRGKKNGGAIVAPPFTADAPTRLELGLGGDAGKKRVARAKKLAEIAGAKLDEVIAGLKADDKPVTPNSILAAIRQANKDKKTHDLASAVFSESGPFDVAVIDPPWTVQKIDRDVRPNQDAFDYPTMTLDEIEAWWRSDLADKLKPDCHVFVWTTNKLLPATFELLGRVGPRYVLTMVWHKSGGFQPVGLPQYNCEFIVYARLGAPPFVDTKDFNCCFSAPRREHSRKPDDFYDTIRRVTGGSRIDVFSREARDGFAQYGNEVSKFAKVA